jgi:hypothetical protein
MLDACGTLAKKRVLFATFTKEEKCGLMPEYIRRQENRRILVGALVKPANDKGGIHLVSRGFNSISHVSYFGLATVIGQQSYGSHIRLLFLHVPWENREGHRLHFGEASSHDLKVVVT